jgi:hypothetical protein
MFRLIGALALVVSFGLFAQVEAKPAKYEFVMPPFIVRATPLPRPLLVPGHLALQRPVCLPNVCDTNVLCQTSQCGC